MTEIGISIKEARRALKQLDKLVLNEKTKLTRKNEYSLEYLQEYLREIYLYARDRLDERENGKTF